MLIAGGTRHRMIAGFALWAVMSTAAHAQSALTGIVHDPSGQLAVGATITVFDLPSLTPHAPIRTSAIGYYELGLPPGDYGIRADLDTLTFIGTAHVAENEKTAFDIYLQFRTHDRVTVPADLISSLTSPSDLAGGRTFTHATIDRLTLASGRTIQSLLSFVPGIVVTDSVGTLAQFTAAGQRRFANRLTVDGVSADLAIDARGLGIGEAGSGALPAVATSGGTQTLVPLAAVESVTIRTTSTGADEARTPGAQTAIVTRAGGDRYHGAGVLDMRPAGLSADDWFHNDRGTKGRSRLVDSSLSAGGPVLTKRLSIFGAWETQYVDRPVSASAQVPSLSVRETARPDMQSLLNAWPRPNGPDAAAGLASFDVRFPVASMLSTAGLRMDATLTARHRMFLRANRGTSHGDAVGTGEHLPDYSFTHTERTTTETETLGLASTLRATMVNELRVNFSANRGTLVADAAAALGARDLPLDQFAPNSSADTWLRVNLFAGPGGSVTRGRTGAALQQQFELTDTLLWLHGAHEIRVGGDLTRVRCSTPGSHRLTYTFTNALQALQGRARQALSEDVAPARARFLSGALFLQDTYRLTPHLTLSYGLRYSVAPAPRSETDLQPALMRYEALPALLPQSEAGPLWHTSWSDVAPQAGIAWHLGGFQRRPSTLRAAWDRSYDTLASPGASAFGRAAPFVTRRILAPAILPVTDWSASVAFPDLDERFAFPMDLRRPHTDRWTIGADQELGVARVSAAYIGAHGHDLIYWQSWFAGDHQSQPIDVFSNAASATYHALAVEVTRRLSRALDAHLAYTWSHAIDTDSGEPSAAHLPIAIEPSEMEHASSDYDRRHVVRGAVSLEVPALPGPAWLRTLAGAWRLDVLSAIQSGAPFSVTVARDLGIGTYVVRPDVVSNVPTWIADPLSPGGRRVNQAAFAVGSPTQGTLGRNTLQASALKQIDLALTRTICFGTRVSTQFRLEAFNVANRPNFGVPLVRLQTAGFGQPYESYADALGTGTLTQGGLPPVLQVGSPRSLQLGLRVNW